MDDYDHIHEHLRGKDWKEDPKRVKQLRQAEATLNRKRGIDGSRRRISRKLAKNDQAKTATDNQASIGKYHTGLALIALASITNPVRDSWLLNNAATNYIYNNIKLLHDFRPSITPDKLESGTQSLNI